MSEFMLLVVLIFLSSLHASHGTELASQNVSKIFQTNISSPDDNLGKSLAVTCEEDTLLKGLLYLNNVSNLSRCITPLDQAAQKTILVTGGAGFIGSHLIDSLILDGHNIIVIDNLHTGRKSNLARWFGHTNFKFIEDSVESKKWSENLIKLDEIYHLASPASPKAYSSNKIYTISTITLGTMNMLELAKKHKARIVLASTSEVYGSPEVHPQAESYWGNVNSVGPRSCYDEGKRLAEAMAVAYRDEANVSVGIARIFNTYGPRMRQTDGRVVSNFITQTFRNVSITIYGDGEQTRSFLYVSDLIKGLKRLMASRIMSPINLGSTFEVSVSDLAHAIRGYFGHSSTSKFIYSKLPVDDPSRRRPDISLARRKLNWNPQIKLEDGLKQTISYSILEEEP